ncbi:metal ABC transporter substrate-binding protein [Marinobacter zhejiangensis]|uniref:Zinc/manganese transport system substrate-binding protein n=1 Tax=Marinobacter zhejiangensis TaxID=488535 RepID=A0A1I4PZN4_9GAMM|nr:zinc ABC transporter substrate-binding protein [Marinobacter zhejiangensis]SFM33066.1 zinc/manganese transport system substrate-binding protein [Marinobacter zhejiangensis]
MDSKRLLLFLTFALLVVPSPATASLRVFACEPEWASLVRQLLPDAAITTATTVWQDPHYIEARPSLIAAMRNADLAVCTGASLEAGWLPTLISRAANRAIRPGQPGLFMAADQVSLHQPHNHVDRSLGDVHPEGDPHLHLDPDKLPQVATALADRLIAIAPEQGRDIQRRLIQWRVQWNLQRAQWRQTAQSLEGMTLVVQHSNFGYLLRWLGVASGPDLEPKPGLPPTAAHLNQLLQDPQLEQAQGILVSSYQDRQPAEWLATRTGLPVLVMPGTVTGAVPTETLAALIDHILTSLKGLNRSEAARHAQVQEEAP